MNNVELAPLVVKMAFILFACAAVGGALFLFFTKNILYGAYGLLLSLISLSGVYILAGAEFIAISQLMIYVGGILILLIFGIMLSAQKGARKEALLVQNVNNLPALFLAFILTGGLIYLNLHLDYTGELPSSYSDSLRQLGLTLMTGFVLILELIGVFLLVALIGASYLAKKEEL